MADAPEVKPGHGSPSRADGRTPEIGPSWTSGRRGVEEASPRGWTTSGPISERDGGRAESRTVFVLTLVGVGALAVVLLALQPFFASPRRTGLPPPQAGEAIGVGATSTPAVASPSRSFSPAPVSLSTRMASPTHRPSPKAKPKPTVTATTRPTARPSTAPASTAPPPPPPSTTQPPAPGPGELSPLPPSQEPSLRSSGGGPETFVDFVNTRSEPVVVYWLDYDGRRQPYASLQPGQSHRQQTYVGHPWVVTDAGGVALVCFLPAPEIARAVVR